MMTANGFLQRSISSNLRAKKDMVRVARLIVDEVAILDDMDVETKAGKFKINSTAYRNQQSTALYISILANHISICH
jgi:hypothetical protein